MQNEITELRNKLDFYKKTNKAWLSYFSVSKKITGKVLLKQFVCKLFYLDLMTRPLLILIAVFLAGLIILFLPDNNDRIIRLNKIHGPSLQDLAGLVLMISVWVTCCVLVIKKWHLVIKVIGRSTAYFLVLLYLFSLSGVVLALILSLDLLLWISIAIAVITNVSVIITAIRAKNNV